MAQGVRITNTAPDPAFVDPVGIIGSQYQVALQSSINSVDPATGTTGEVWTSSAGFKQATFTAVNTITSGHYIAIRYGTDETTAIEAEVSDILGAIGTTTEVSYPNTVILNVNRPTATIRWDGGTTIKRVCVGGSHSATYKVNMEYIA